MKFLSKAILLGFRLIKEKKTPKLISLRKSEHCGYLHIKIIFFQIEFFENGDDPSKVLDNDHGVLFVKKPDGRSTGDAFVLFR